MRPIATAVLAIAAAACFLAAATSAIELRERTGATARHHQWQAPSLHSPIAEPVADVAPAMLEAEPVADVAPAMFEAEPDDLLIDQLLGPAIKKSRPAAPLPTVPMVARASNGVEPEDAIRMALRGKRASFEHCYQTELKKQASFSGFIVVALSLSASGQVTDARVQEGNRRDAVVGACIVAQLRTLKLPALTSEADLLIPIRLQAREPT